MARIDDKDWEIRHTLIDWNVQREGRRWSADETDTHYFSAPGRVDMVDGKLYWSEADRLTMLGLLLENVGADAAVRIGDPNVWREAVKGLADG